MDLPRYVTAEPLKPSPNGGLAFAPLACEFYTASFALRKTTGDLEGFYLWYCCQCAVADASTPRSAVCRESWLRLPLNASNVEKSVLLLQQLEQDLARAASLSGRARSTDKAPAVATVPAAGHSNNPGATRPGFGRLSKPNVKDPAFQAGPSVGYTFGSSRPSAPELPGSSADLVAGHGTGRPGSESRPALSQHNPGIPGVGGGGGGAGEKGGVTTFWGSSPAGPRADSFPTADSEDGTSMTTFTKQTSVSSAGMERSASQVVAQGKPGSGNGNPSPGERFDRTGQARVSGCETAHQEARDRDESYVKDDYWEWDMESQKFRHWDDKKGAYIICPDTFD